MGQKLGLSPHSSLIDIGAGAGWPGLYLSSISGCSLTLVDLPETGLKLAADRSIQDKISERVTTIGRGGSDASAIMPLNFRLRTKVSMH